ncbi:hypothetical protein GCM10022278_09860 [Allohahella marinimesophila]|uniref:histidine kinase n=2 Tax=Allohahella marinimesophila TaxID=1054972 RepID=A0ABP7NTD9_9GAMM
MDSRTNVCPAVNNQQFPSGATAQAELIRSTDWSSLAVGPTEQWPQSLQALVSYSLASNDPVNIIWGPECTQIYNDAYEAICGDKHPGALGMDFRACWASGWSVIGPAFEQALAGETSELENQRLFLLRQGRLEETFFNLSFSPVHDEGGKVTGVVQRATETTRAVIGERRTRALGDLTKALAQAESTDDVFRLSVDTLARYDADLPFVVLYHQDSEQTVYRLAGSAGVEPGLCVSPPQLSTDEPGIWPIATLLEQAQRQAVSDLRALLDGVACGPYEEAPDHAFAIPIMRAGDSAPAALLMAGACPRLPLDDAYAEFYDLVVSALSAALTRIFQIEVMRTQALLQAQIAAERDRNALLQSQAEFAALFEQASAGIAETGCDGRLLRVNNQFCKILGRSREALIGQLAMDFVHPEDREENSRRLQELMSSVQAFDIYNRYQRPDGSGVWVSKTVTPIRVRGRSGVERILAVVIDATERNQAEAQLEAASRNKDEFLAMLAHELRYPLAPIKAAARAIGLANLDEATLNRTSAVISRQVRHMTALVDDLLDVSRVSRGIVTISRSPQDIANILANAIEQVQPLFDARQHRLITDIDPDSGWVLGDEKRLIQIHTNLLSNAAKYTPEQGTIVLRTGVDEDVIRISIEDNGIGIEKALQAGMFELFAQAKRTPDRSQGGLGLGLALVKNLAELHDGSVACVSKGIGQGSTFTVTLPRLAQSTEESGHSKPDPETAGSNRALRILLVDDNVDAIDMLSLLLKTIGHEVTMQYTSKAALEAAKEQFPDVAILDIGLPDMDGNALARRLRAQPETRHLILIALTGYGQAEDRKKAIEAGFDHYLTKPVDFDELRGLLKTIASALRL